VTHTTDIAIVPDYYASIFSCTGLVRLVADRDTGTTVRTAAGEVTVRVPLVGGRAEAAIISGLREHAEREAIVLDQWTASNEHRHDVG
jgi:hypothetical protein